MTEPELMLWSRLRGHGLDGVTFRRQTPIGPYIVDFFCPAKKLIVELDGSQHLTDEGRAADGTRSDWLEAQGYRLIRFTNLDVVENLDGVWRMIGEAVGVVEY
jgi:very-short-patch-repair endonuclease